MVKPTKKLRKTHYEQMLSCVKEFDHVGYYYGNKEQFDKRQTEIRAWLERMIRTHDE